MKIRTTVGQHLKRLAKRYANAAAAMAIWDCSEGTTSLDEQAELHGNFLRARKALYDAIDELTSVDYTPRALQDLL